MKEEFVKRTEGGGRELKFRRKKQCAKVLDLFREYEVA